MSIPFEVIAPLPDAQVTVVWQKSEQGVVCSASCAHPFTASTYIPDGLGRPFAVQIAEFDRETFSFVAGFLLRDELEWAEIRFPNSDEGFMLVREGVPVQTLNLGVAITFEEAGK